MFSIDLNVIIFVLALIYCVLFRKRIKCIECGKVIKTVTYAQLGTVLLLMTGSRIVHDLMVGDSINYYSRLLFLTPALYYLCSEPKFYCRHCMKGIPFRKEYLLK